MFSKLYNYIMLKIEVWENNEILRKIATKIQKEDIPKAIKLWKEMIKYIKNPKNGWVGLAAPQVWHSIRLMIVSLLRDWNDENFKTVLMINPEILEHNNTTDIEKEWCLSLPWKSWEVERYTAIKLKYTDEKKSEKIVNLSWVSARIVQHELDHLNGILFIDYLK